MTEMFFSTETYKLFLLDSWKRIIVSIASVPCLAGLKGVILLVIGIIATGYLATSFDILWSNYIWRKHFSKKFLIPLTIRNVGLSFSLELDPNVAYLLLHEARLKTGLQLRTSM